jgi:hypothetical protein
MSTAIFSMLAGRGKEGNEWGGNSIHVLEKSRIFIQHFLFERRERTGTGIAGEDGGWGIVRDVLIMMEVYR